MKRGRISLVSVVALATACGEPTTSGNPAPLSVEEVYSFPSLAPTDFITSFDFTSDGTLWAVFFQGSIVRVRQGVSTRFDAAAILGASEVRDLFIDAMGRAWVTGGRAVAVFDGSAWERQDPPDFMGLSQKAGEIAVNASGDVLLAAGDANAGGLLLRQGSNWQAITPSNSELPSPIVMEIEPAPDRSFWVASSTFQGRGGLTRITAGTVSGTFNGIRSGLLYDHIDDLSIANGRIWLGFAVPIHDVLGFPDGGIQSLPVTGGSPSTWFPSQEGLGSNRVQSLVVSSAGEVWFVTGLDEDSGCLTCVSSIGALRPDGGFDIISHINSELAPNEFMPQIRAGPDGEIYVARADRNQIVRVFRAKR